MGRRDHHGGLEYTLLAGARCVLRDAKRSASGEPPLGELRWPWLQSELQSCTASWLQLRQRRLHHAGGSSGGVGVFRGLPVPRLASVCRPCWRIPLPALGDMRVGSVHNAPHSVWMLP